MDQNAPVRRSLLDAARRRAAAPCSLCADAPAHRRRFLQAAEQLYFAPDEVVLEPASGVSHLLRCARAVCAASSGWARRGPLPSSRASCSRSARCWAHVPSPPPTRPAATPSACACPHRCARWWPTARPLPTSSTAACCSCWSCRSVRCRQLCRRARWPSSRSKRRWHDFVDARRAAGGAAADCRWPGAAGRCTTAASARCWSTAPDGAALGILTRHDMLDRVVLPQRSLDVAMAEVMSAPVHTLTCAACARRRAADVARRRAPCADHRRRPRGGHRVRARPVCAAAAVAAPARARPSTAPTAWRCCSRRRPTSAALRSSCWRRAWRRAS
jgi:CBS domain-containing protein